MSVLLHKLDGETEAGHSGPDDDYIGVEIHAEALRPGALLTFQAARWDFALTGFYRTLRNTSGIISRQLRLLEIGRCRGRTARELCEPDKRVEMSRREGIVALIILIFCIGAERVCWWDRAAGRNFGSYVILIPHWREVRILGAKDLECFVV